MGSSVGAWAVVVVMLAVMVFGVALGLGGWFPEVISGHGPGVQRMLDFTFSATGFFFVAGHLVLAWLIVRAIRRPQGEGVVSGRTQRRVAIIPAIAMAIAAEGGVIALGLPVWGRYYGPPPKDALVIQATGRQFFWAFQYAGADMSFGKPKPELMTDVNSLGLDPKDPAAADDIVVLNEMWVPRGRAVQLVLRSYDVIHSFFVRELRVKQDAVPGMAIPVWFDASKTGDYEIACNQICGLGHYRMRGVLHVVEPADFERWLASQEAFGTPAQ